MDGGLLRNSNRRATRSNRPRRQLVWSTLAGGFSQAAASTPVTVDLLTPVRVAGVGMVGATVRRTIVTWFVTSAVTNGDVLSWGLMQLPITNVGNPAPAGAPNPNTQPSEDWAWWETRVATKTANFPGYWPNGSNQWTIDARAGRKLGEIGETWTLSYNFAIAGTVPVTGELVVRTLLALP